MEIEDKEAFYEFVRSCFKQRRKTLYNNLKENYEAERIEKAFQALSLSEGIRAQEIPAEEFIDIFRLVK